MKGCGHGSTDKGRQYRRAPGCGPDGIRSEHREVVGPSRDDLRALASLVRCAWIRHRAGGHRAALWLDGTPSFRTRRAHLRREPRVLHGLHAAYERGQCRRDRSPAARHPAWRGCTDVRRKVPQVPLRLVRRIHRRGGTCHVRLVRRWRGHPHRGPPGPGHDAVVLVLLRGQQEGPFGA